MNVEYIHFSNREIRAQYIADRFKKLFEGKKVLDVGCDEARLKTLIPHKEYVGIDIGGKPDIEINLEQIDRLPFDDDAFDCVICSDVLEHINNLHQIFGELVRVSRGEIIISLPNNWCCARRPIEKGHGSFAHYGLPIDPVVDRHKWFFCLSDAKKFMEGQTEKYPIQIQEMYATEKPRSSILKSLRKLYFGAQENYLNRYSNTLWTVFEKKKCRS